MSEKLTTSEMATMLEKIATDVNGAVASSLMKTLLSKNITIDDWNTFAKILVDHSINDTVLQEFSEAVVEYLKALDSKDTSLTSDISTLQTDVSGAKDEITTLKDRMDLAETDISTNAGDVTRLFDSVDKNTTDIADLKESKLDKTGGTISGNLDILGNLNVLGKTIQTILENLNVEAAVIATNANGATLTTLSGFVTRIDLDTTYGIMYDPASNSVKLGIVTTDENGVWRFADGEGSPVATRADSTKMTGGKVITWNEANRRMETTGIPAAVDGIPTENSSNLITSGAVYSAIVQTLNTEV